MAEPEVDTVAGVNPRSRTGRRRRWRGRERVRMAHADWFKLTLMMAGVVLAVDGGGARAQEMSSCCVKAQGSCRSVCEKMSLVEIASDSAMREDRIQNIYKFCSPALAVLVMACLLYAVDPPAPATDDPEVMEGDGWWGRACCALPRGAECRRACATGSDERAVHAACRRSDELAFFDCVQRQQDSQFCCSQTHSERCHEACRDILWRTSRGSGGVGSARSRVTAACEEHSPSVMQCVRNLTRTATATNPLKYLPCCQQSTNASCRYACRAVLRSTVNSHEIIDGLLGGGCGAPLPHDAFWQCFLRKDSQVEENDGNVINRIGIDSAKLHCCQKAKTAMCRRLCFNTYNRDWVDNWMPFDSECLKRSHETDLAQCVQEVEEPCELGCEGLTYCSNFNNRPTALFRSCTASADVTAHLDVNAQLVQGYVGLPGLQLPVRNSSVCSADLWKAVACMLQVKPCTHEEHGSRICHEDCYRLLSECVDWPRARASSGAVTVAQLCSELADPRRDAPCLSLQNYLLPSAEPMPLSHAERVTSPCAGAPCNSSQVCLVNRACPHGLSCARYTCLPGCPIGEASQYLVPVGTYVRVPIGDPQKGCLKICRCGARGALESCQPLPCFSYDNCSLVNKMILHGSTYYMECNPCKCYAGERLCSRRACADRTTALLTRLPCNCPAHHLPVCVAARTHSSACLAKCAGYLDSDIEPGPCSALEACRGVACGEHLACVPRPTVCISLLQRPCHQYVCVNTRNCSSQARVPVCDTEGRTHDNPCWLLARGQRLAYHGECLSDCQQQADGAVCGANGNTYESECAARADLASVDYRGACLAVGPISDLMEPKCTLDRIVCPPLQRARCEGFTAPGACCPRCGGALRVLYSKKQIDRALYAMDGHSTDVINLHNVLKSLQRHVTIAECALNGHLSIEMEIFVTIESVLEHPSELQLRLCVLEAERLASLINRESARIVTDLNLSALMYALVVHTYPTSGATVLLTISVVSLVISLVTIVLVR